MTTEVSVNDRLVKLEPTRERNVYSVTLPITVEGDPNTTEARFLTLAMGYILAADIASKIGDDYDRRVRIGVSSTNCGMDPVLTFRREGKNAPMRSELSEIVFAALVDYNGGLIDG
jgi:hypothetical protein